MQNIRPETQPITNLRPPTLLQLVKHNPWRSEAPPKIPKPKAPHASLSERLRAVSGSGSLGASRSFFPMGGEPFVENGCEAVNYLAEKYWNRGFDAITRTLGIGSKSDTGDRRRSVARRKGSKYNSENTAPAPVTSAAGGFSGRKKNYNSFSSTPSPESSIHAWEKERYREQIRAEQQGDSSLDRLSEHSDQVIRAYHLDPNDPVRRPNTTTNTILLNANTNNPRDYPHKMSYQNGSLAPGQYQQQQRATSAQPPRTRYYDDDDEYGSDYDDRRGSRYQNTGRGYDDRDRGYGYDDRGGGGGGYDDRDGNYREVIETERYKGVSGALVVRLHAPKTNPSEHTQLTYFLRSYSPPATSTNAANPSAPNREETTPTKAP